MKLRILIALAVVVVLGAIGGALYSVNAHATSSQARLEQQVTQLRTQVAEQSNALQADSSQLALLSNQIGAISKPTDPLAAYTDICSQDFTNQQTQVYQTYWFPCTNSSETIPQPGN